MGKREEEAYYIEIVKNITMTAEGIEQGKLIVKVGMAAVKPAEFIILEFSSRIQVS